VGSTSAPSTTTGSFDGVQRAADLFAICSTQDNLPNTVHGRHLPVWLIVCATAWLVGTLCVTATPLVQLALGTATRLLAGLVCISCSARSLVVAPGLMEATRHVPVFRVQYRT
jgi:hypothetical protein